LPFPHHGAGEPEGAAGSELFELNDAHDTDTDDKNLKASAERDADAAPENPADAPEPDKAAGAEVPVGGQLAEAPDDGGARKVTSGEFIESGKATVDTDAGPSANELSEIVPKVRGAFDEENLGDGYYDEVVDEKRGFVSRVVNRWIDRLVGAANEGSFANQEAEYASGRTTRDYILNTAGTGIWGLVFPILSIVVTQLCGADLAGKFSLAFVVGNLLMILGNFGVRTFQVSDTKETHSFGDYQINRVITCILMVIATYAYCRFRGYDADMFLVVMGVCCYRAVDALGDVYEGRLQQADKMYLAGLSIGFRSVVAIVFFTVTLLITGLLQVACIIMAVAAFASFFVLTLPLALMETPRSRKWSMKGVFSLFKLCAPLFVALFLYSLTDNMPKFLMEGALSYDNQLYFNVFYFCAQGILITTQMIYRPLLLRLADAWDDPDKRSTFNKIIIAVFAAVVAITVFSFAIMAWIGVPILSFLYGIDFEQFRTMLYLMVIAGGVTAAIDFLYQVITVQRKQNTVVKLYLITFAFSILATLLLMNLLGLLGVVIAYLAEMVLLLVLVICQLANIRVNIKSRRTPNEDGVGQTWA
jgi:O-antigen/teichoic acid export membrane protein